MPRSNLPGYHFNGQVTIGELREISPIYIPYKDGFRQFGHFEVIPGSQDWPKPTGDNQ